MGKHRHRPLGYRIIDKTVDGDGTALPFAQFTCTGTGCTATIDIAIKRDAAQNPEWLAEQATRSSWRADARRAAQTMCPTCLKKRRSLELHKTVIEDVKAALIRLDGLEHQLGLRKAG